MDFGNGIGIVAVLLIAVVKLWLKLGLYCDCGACVCLHACFFVCLLWSRIGHKYHGDEVILFSGCYLNSRSYCI